jgi:hypothetical protein
MDTIKKTQNSISLTVQIEKTGSSVGQSSNAPSATSPASQCSSMFDDLSGKKRKHQTSPSIPKTNSNDPTESTLLFLRSTIRTALYEAKIAQALSSETSYLVELLSTMDEALNNLLTKKCKIGNPITEYRICEHHNEDGVVKNQDFPVSTRNIFEVRTTRKSIQKRGRY